MPQLSFLTSCLTATESGKGVEEETVKVVLTSLPIPFLQELGLSVPWTLPWRTWTPVSSPHYSETDSTQLAFCSSDLVFKFSPFTQCQESANAQGEKQVIKVGLYLPSSLLSNTLAPQFMGVSGVLWWLQTMTCVLSDFSNCSSWGHPCTAMC